MKTLLYSTLLLVSLSTHATLQLVDSQITVNPIVTQKAQESGVGFTSNSEQYQLIADGYAQQQNTVNIGSLSDGLSIPTQWSSQRGSYQVFISSDSASQVIQSASASSSGYNQIALNPRTGNVAIITGQIVVTFANNTTAQSIASSYNINLSRDYPRLNTAFFTVNAEQDIFSIAKALNEDAGVTSAQVDVIEHFAQPM
jgi:hypothetical protein